MLVCQTQSHAELPQDIGALQALVRELRSHLVLEKAGREKAEAKVKDLLRRLFGPKSEKLDPNQLALALDQVERDSALAVEVQPPRIAPLPPRVIPQAGVGPGLLAHLLVSKYVDHLPLNRIEQIAAREGVDLPRQKQCRWVEDCAHLLLTVMSLDKKVATSRSALGGQVSGC